MAAARPRPQVMRLTEAAADRIKAVMAKADRRTAAVRVGVKNGGCAGMSYYMEYTEEIDPLDEVIETRECGFLSIPRRFYSCSAPRWTTRSRNCPRNLPLAIRTRPRPAAAENPCRSSRRAKRRSAGNLTMMATAAAPCAKTAKSRGSARPGSAADSRVSGRSRRRPCAPRGLDGAPEFLFALVRH